MVLGKIIAELRGFNLKAAKTCLEKGLRYINQVDDSGYSKAIFVSPKTYEEITLSCHVPNYRKNL